MNQHLLIIDPQNDFCDLPAGLVPSGEAPALPVRGAHADMERVAKLIDAAGSGLAAIHVTLDSHHHIDVAHPTFWMDGAGGPVAPFTQIALADVQSGRLVPRDPAAMVRVLSYLAALEAAGRYQLMVWPTHCEMGTWGHNVHASVRTAYNRWEERTLRTVNKVSKGTNPWTEHYSAIQAEVPDAEDDSTQVNAAFIARLRTADRVYITGEAGSHCVKATTEHIVEHWDPAQLHRLVIVTDCMSPVTGFETQHDGFIRAMRERGLTIAQASDVAAELAAA